MKTKLSFLIVMALIISLVNCSGMSKQEQTTLSGAAIGGAAGGVLGAVMGDHALAGAAIGAGVGALGGYIAGEQHDGYYRGGGGGPPRGYDGRGRR